MGPCATWGRKSAISTEAVTTSEIEGEILDRASVQSSLRKQLGLATDKRRVRPAERGMAEMMADLYRSFAEPLTEEMLFCWHRMVMSGSRNLKDVGCYRPGAEPMQVISGPIGVTIEAQRRTIALVEFLIDKTKLLDRLKGQLDARQEKELLRMFREGPDGFRGGLSAGKYITITGVSPATTTRDLADLVAKGALVREGERRHARYHLSVPAHRVPHVTLSERGQLVESE